METIVVGVDGSEGGAAALDYAAGEAAFRNARLRIVSVWQVPVAAYGGDFGPPMDPSTWDAFRLAAERVADEARTTAQRLQPAVAVDVVTVQGHASDVLIEQSADAGLVVVGRRGLGGFRSLLLGSVSQQVVQHAACPVVVVNQAVRTAGTAE